MSALNDKKHPVQASLIGIFKRHKRIAKFSLSFTYITKTHDLRLKV